MSEPTAREKAREPMMRQEVHDGVLVEVECCRNAAWRYHLCPYHEGWEAGRESLEMSEPTPDDPTLRDVLKDALAGLPCETGGLADAAIAALVEHRDLTLAAIGMVDTTEVPVMSESTPTPPSLHALHISFEDGDFFVRVECPHDDLGAERPCASWANEDGTERENECTYVHWNDHLTYAEWLHGRHSFAPVPITVEWHGDAPEGRIVGAGDV